jgi:hypothetical protein
MGGAGWYPDDEFVILRGDGARCAIHAELEMLSVRITGDEDIGKSLGEALGSGGD